MPSPADASCVSLEGRSDGAPGWCTEFTQDSCEDHFVTNIHSIKRPCVWLDVGCHASNASACGDFPLVEMSDGSSSHAGEGETSAFTWIMVLVFLLVMLLSIRAWYLHRIGLPALGSLSKASRAAPNEELECLHDDEEANTGMNGGLTPASSGLLSEEARREIEVSCVAASAILDSNTATAALDGQQTATDGAAEQRNAENSTDDVAGGDHHAEGSHTPHEEKQNEQGNYAKREQRNSDEIELPSYRLRESFAAFDSGELVDQTLNSHQKSVPTSSTEKEDDDSDDDTFSRPFKASNKHLALSLD